MPACTLGCRVGGWALGEGQYLPTWHLPQLKALGGGQVTAVDWCSLAPKVQALSGICHL